MCRGEGDYLDKYLKNLKLVLCVLEAFLAIPVIGWMVVWNTGLPILVMLVLHSVTLIISLKLEGKKIGNITGIIASLLAIFPFIGWAMHVTTAIILFKDIRGSSNKQVAVNRV